MITQDIRKAAEEIKILIQNDIRRKGLVKSGRMLNSIKVSFAGDTGIKIISAVDYFNDVDKDNKIISDVKKSAEFKEIMQSLASAYVKEILKKD